MNLSQGRCWQLAKTKTQGALGLASYNDIFEPINTITFQSTETVVNIPLTELRPPEFHPFQVRGDIDMERLTVKVKRDGVLIPGIARPRA